MRFKSVLWKAVQFKTSNVRFFVSIPPQSPQKDLRNWEKACTLLKENEHWWKGIQIAREALYITCLARNDAIDYARNEVFGSSCEIPWCVSHDPWDLMLFFLFRLRVSLKFETHLAVCVRRILTRKDRTPLCTVHILRIMLCDTQKNWIWFNFCAYHAEYHVCSVFFCDAKYAHKTQTHTADVIRPLELRLQGVKLPMRSGVSLACENANWFSQLNSHWQNCMKTQVLPKPQKLQSFLQLSGAARCVAGVVGKEFWTDSNWTGITVIKISGEKQVFLDKSAGGSSEVSCGPPHSVNRVVFTCLQCCCSSSVRFFSPLHELQAPVFAEESSFTWVSFSQLVHCLHNKRDRWCSTSYHCFSPQHELLQTKPASPVYCYFRGISLN